MTLAQRLAVELGAPLGDRDGTRLAPMLCGRDESGERVLGRDGWLFELKLDGVRILADKRNERVSLGYRKGRDATDSYPEIAAALALLGEQRVVLDGEIVAFDDDGKPSFQRLGTRIQSRGSNARRAAVLVPVVYVVFDVLVVGDRDVTGLPIEARKAILEQILGDSSKVGGPIRMHPTFPKGTELFRLCREQQLEGVVAKRAGSAYRPGDRSADWVKVKCELDGDFVVIGWTLGEGRRSRLGALDLGVYDGPRLLFRGNVGSGLDEDMIDVLIERLKPLEVPRAVAQGKYSAKRGRRHVSPEVVVSVRHVGVTEDGALRFPVFRGLRHDLRPEDCTVDSPALGPEGEVRRSRITAPSAVVLPDGTTKGALCKYYEAMAHVLLPCLRGRTCPPLRADGRALWPLPEWTPSWVRTHVVARGKKGELRGVIADDVDTLLFLVEAGAASLQMTAAREAAPATADFVALRLGGANAWEVALRTRDVVEATGLAAFAKTSGAGFDVVVPIGPAPAQAADVLGALFGQLVGPFAETVGVTVEAVEAPIAPYAVMLPVAPGGCATASVPLDWKEGPDPRGTAALPLDAVRERFADPARDPLRLMRSATVDFARAVVALEDLVR